MTQPTGKQFVFLLSMFIVILPRPSSAIGDEPYVRFENKAGGFPLSASGRSAPLCASSNDYPGVLRILKIFQNDIAAVTGAKPEMYQNALEPLYAKLR